MHFGDSNSIIISLTFCCPWTVNQFLRYNVNPILVNFLCTYLIFSFSHWFFHNLTFHASKIENHVILEIMATTQLFAQSRLSRGRIILFGHFSVLNRWFCSKDAILNLYENCDSGGSVGNFHICRARAHFAIKFNEYWSKKMLAANFWYIWIEFLIM